MLIVEDNLQNMRMMEMVLQAGGYALFEAFDGHSALEMAVSKRPDLIIMDIQLPVMSGVEVTRRLREMPEFKNVPIVAMTAYAMKGDRERFMADGFNAYVSKPINTRELPKLVAQMLAIFQAGGEIPDMGGKR